jgi:cytochrome P450
MLPALHKQQIMTYRGVIATLTQQALDSWTLDAVRDIHGEMVRLALAIALRVLFGADGGESVMLWVNLCICFSSRT